MIPISNNQKRSYKLFSISNECGIKLQLVSNFNLINNEAKSCFRAQTSQDWKYKLIRISNNQKWSYKLFNLVNNKAKNCFRAQTSQEWNNKLIPISNNRKWNYKLFSTSNESGIKLQVVSNFNLVNNEAPSGLQAQTNQK